jgi:carbon-monoxide dehydrogenase medium subunit
MKNFEYFSPQNVQEAHTLLSQYSEEAKIIAGGQSLLILLKQGLISPSVIIDIKGISELDYIHQDKKDGLRIGALTSHRTLETLPLMKENFYMLAEMEHRLASVQIRNWGTVGGNLCHGEPASDLAPCFIALDAEVKLSGPAGDRLMKVEEFFEDYYKTALKSDEILTEIHLPILPPGGGIYVKTGVREKDMALAGVAAFIVLDPKNRGVCRDIRIVMGSVGPTPIRTTRAEDILRGQKVDDRLIDTAAQIASEDSQPIPDIHASEEYKKELVKVLVQHTVKEAMTRASAAAH